MALLPLKVKRSVDEHAVISQNNDWGHGRLCERLNKSGRRNDYKGCHYYKIREISTQMFVRRYGCPYT